MKHFYAQDYANEAQQLHAFTVKEARDNFVESGNRRFSRTSKEADKLCKRAYECTAREAVEMGYI